VDLWIVRHAPALPARPELANADRPLTPKGGSRFRRAVEGLRRIGVSFDALLTSPARRAVQTAALLAPLLEGTPEETPLLARAPGPELLARLRGRRVGLVGHQPWLSELLALLCFGGAERAGQLVLKKGGVAWLQGRPVPGGMALVSLWRPRALRALARRAR
jgi:phosphohistidine phosphatase